MNRSPDKSGAFTLVELLVVITIIAMLVMLLVPLASRAKALAAKAVCATQLKDMGTASASYVAQYRQYPYTGAGGSRGGWPKMFGILLMMDFQRTNPVFDTNGNRLVADFDWDPSRVPNRILCPAMDPYSIWSWAEGLCLGGDDTHAGKVWTQRACIGYQWNVTLRALSGQRYPASLYPCSKGWWDNSYRIDYFVEALPTTTNPNGLYLTQAISPFEIISPANVAEAWDSWDRDSVPNINFQSGYVMENYLPGWHAGPACSGAGGWSVLNAGRHTGSPNILYADGAVHADATYMIKETDLGSCPSGSWSGLKACSWPDFDRVGALGSLSHVAPSTAVVP